MSQSIHSSDFQRAIETVEELPPEEQAMLIEIVRQRLIEERRGELADEISAGRGAYERGDVTRGTTEDLLKELAE
jgi:ClpP class serine protease